MVGTDNGVQFAIRTFKSFLNEMGIRQQFNAPYTPQETPDENANKLRKIFEIVQRYQEKASQDHARHCNLRRRQEPPALGDVVWAKEHHLFKAAEGFASYPRYDVLYQVVDFLSPVICKIRHIQTKKERTIHVGELKQQQTQAANMQTADTESSDSVRKATGLCIRPKRESSISHAEGIKTRIVSLDRKATGFSVGHFPKSSVISQAERTYKVTLKGVR